MERVIVPKGTKQNLETVFSDLQENTKVNLKRRFDRMVSSYGIDATINNGTVTSTELKVTQATATTLTIAEGKAVTSSFNFIRTLSATTVNLSAVASGNYTIIAKASPYTDTPTALVNGFLYDASGGTTTNTREHASVSFEVQASGYTATTSGIYLANIAWNGVDTATIYDRRDENIFLLKDSAINDSNIVKKDRDSTITADLNQVGEYTLQMSDSADSFTLKNELGTVVASLLKTKNYFTQNTGFGGQTVPEHAVDATGTVRATTSVKSDLFTSDDAADVTIQPNTTGGHIITKLYDDTGQGQFQDKDGTVIAYYDKDTVQFNKPVTHTELMTVTSLTATGTMIMPPPETTYMSGVRNTSFKLGVGDPLVNSGAGVAVLTEYAAPSTPTNFRIYDIKPTANKDEAKSYVHFKWNYDDINGSDLGGGTFLVTSLLGGGNLDEVAANIEGKYLYFPESGTKYLITDWNNTTKVITATGYAGEEPTIPEFPARIIDYGTAYDLKIKSNRDNGAEFSDLRKSKTDIIRLDTAYLYNPQFSTKIDLNTTNWIQLRSVNENTFGSFALLPSGVYDPDHTPGGQAEQSYSSPFENTLPTLVDDGTITLDATTFGFTADVGGWYDGTDTDKSAHEFEIAWTTLSAVDWSDTSSTTKIITTNRHIPVTVNEASTYAVAVRGLQNKQVVSLTKAASVSTGGGGIPPNMVLVADTAVDLAVLSGQCLATRTLNTPAVGDAFYTTKLESITYHTSWLSPPDFGRNEMRSQNGRVPEVEIAGHTFSNDIARVIANDATDDATPSITVVGELDTASIASPVEFTVGTT
ncbi:MAG: hypothetical protein H8D23_36705, partial [Candidatus Brocadiales bacterium]|nr:hypothetical protein [Candidatus Brocadiales bacterium]